MPIYTYRCECGKQADVLVRGGREPQTCEDVPELIGHCETTGALTRALTAPYVGSGRSSRGSAEREMPAGCAHCPNAPGSCES